jgi:NADPH:quinone reductase-like Zn-dependent oxidoreductase
MFPLGPQDIEIRIQAVGVNPVDVQTALGRTSRDTIGSDAAGIITRVGPSVSKFNPGERVVTIIPGAFKTVVRFQENMAHPIPKEMTFEVAASLPTDYLTAYYAIITVGRLEKGESLLLHTGACPFGQAAAQIARHLDAETFVTVNTQEERQIAVETYGIQESHIFNGSSKSIAAESAERGGFDLILNCFDGEVRSKALSCVGECKSLLLLIHMFFQIYSLD